MSVDILLATYNSERFLRAQVDSLFKQTFQDFRLLIRDGGSTDGTLQMIMDLQRENPDKVHIVPSEGRSGFLENFHQLLKASDADYMFFCDHDDIWLPEKVEKCLTRIQQMAVEYGENTPLCVHCDLIMADSNAEELKSSLHAAWNMGSTPLDCGYPIDIPCWGCTMVINRALKELALPIDQACAYHDTWCGRIAWYLGKIDFVDESLIRYRVHNNNASCSSTNKYPAVLFRYLKNFSASRKKLGENLIEPTALFVERFAGQLPDFHRKRLAAFGSWRKRMFLTRLYLMIRYRIYAQGVVRTIGLLFL